ncbi:MAG: hypothetical protein AVDCRST_MAG62-529, partial [uncultured Sphingomonas sp.]
GLGAAGQATQGTSLRVRRNERWPRRLRGAGNANRARL